MIEKLFKSEAAIFQGLLVVCLVLFFWMPHGSDVALGFVVLSFLYFSKGRNLTGLEKKFLVIFLISVLAVILLAIVHLDLLENSANEYGKTLFKIGVFGVFLLIVDAVAFQFNYFKISPEKFARIVIYAVFLSVILNFIWTIFAHPNVPLLELFLGGYRKSYLGLMLNSNHADDLFVLQITILLFCNSVLLANGKKDPQILFLSALFILYFIYTIGILGSRGGLIGLLVGLAFVVLLLAAKMNWKASAIYLVVMIVVLAMLPQKHYNRLINNLSVTSFIKVLEKKPQLIVEQKAKELNKQINGQSKSIQVKPVKPTKDKSQVDTTKPARVESAKALVCDFEKMVINNGQTGSFDKSSNTRILLWVDGFYAGLQKPIFGHGEYNKHKLIDDYELKSPCKIKHFSHIHNFYLDLFVRGGGFLVVVFVGLSIFLMYLLLQVIFSKEQYNLVVVPIIVHLIYLFIENIFDLTFFRTSELLNVLLCIATLCGVTFALQNSEQN